MEVAVYIISFFAAGGLVMWWHYTDGSKSTWVEHIYAFLGLLIVSVGSCAFAFQTFGLAFQTLERSDCIALVGIGLGVFVAIDCMAITRRESNKTAARIEAQLSDILSKLPKP